MHRRPFIEALCTAAAVGTIAGCLDDGGGDGGNENEGDDTDPGNGGENDTDEADGNESDDDGNGTDEEDGDTVDGGKNGSDEGDENDTDDGNGTNEDDGNDTGEGDGNDTGEGDGNGTDGDDEDEGGDDASDAPEVTIETVGTDCAGGGSEGDGNAAVEEGDDAENGDGGVDEATIEATGEGAAIRGTIGSPTPCYEARVAEEAVDDGELRLRIGVEEDDSELCMECVGAVEYEATVAGAVKRIIVEHEHPEDDPTEVAQADLED